MLRFLRLVHVPAHVRRRQPPWLLIFFLVLSRHWVFFGKFFHWDDWHHSPLIPWRAVHYPTLKRSQIKYLIRVQSVEQFLFTVRLGADGWWEHDAVAIATSQIVRYLRQDGRNLRLLLFNSCLVNLSQFHQAGRLCILLWYSNFFGDADRGVPTLHESTLQLLCKV